MGKESREMALAIDRRVNSTTQSRVQTETPFFLIQHHPEEESLSRFQRQFDQSYDRISRFLGCRLPEKIPVIICRNYKELWLATIRRPRSLLSVRDDTLVCLSLTEWAETWNRIYHFFEQAEQLPIHVTGSARESQLATDTSLQDFLSQQTGPCFAS